MRMTSDSSSHAADVPLWDFSLSLYAQPGMEALCLALQDQQNINVILLLWALWLDEQEVLYSPGLWLSGYSVAGQWQRWRIKPLRSLRRTLPKRWPWLGLRQRVKHAELDAEHQLLNRLQVMTERVGLAKEQTSSLAERHCYTDQLLSAGDPCRDQLQRIVRRWRGA